MLDWQQQVAASQGKVEATGFSKVYESRTGQDWLAESCNTGERLAMTCSEVQQVLPELLDVPVNGIFPPDFQSHLKSCPDCSGLVSDLKTITGEARQMTASDEPSPLLWLRISAQLRAEGLIRDQESDLTVREDSGRPLVRTFPRPRWSFSWLIPVAAVLLVAGTYGVKHQPAPLVAEHKAPAGAAASMPAATPAPDASP